MATTPKGLSDEKAARMMTVLRNGRTLGTFGVKAPRLEAYFKTHPDFAREARPLIKANNATIGIRRLAAAAVGRQRSADRRRNSETCANGHVRTLENTFYVQNERQCLVRRCKDCNIVARAARMPKAEKVRMLISGLHHGQVISDFRFPELRNFIRCNPKIGDRLRKLSRKNANVRASQAYWSKHAFAASALMQNNGADAYEAVRCATAHLHVDDRNDVMSLMIIAIGEGRLKLSDAQSRVREFLRIHRYRPRVFGDARYSLDNPIGDDSNVTWLDTKTDADRLWG